MDNLLSILTTIQSNLNTIINAVALVLTLFFVWLLAAQIVIFSQGWELYQGTTDRMEG
jgi:low affinity Fe/Cu permease